MPNQGVPVIFKNKIAYGYAEKSVQAYDVSVSDYNALTEQQQLDGSIRFIQGVDAIPNGSNVWAKLGTTPLAEGLPRDCSQAVNQLKSNLTDLEAEKLSRDIGTSVNIPSTGYVCPHDGYLIYYLNATNHQWGWAGIILNGVEVFKVNCSGSVNSTMWTRGIMSVRKGDAIAPNTANSSTAQLNYYPRIPSNS